MRICHTFRCSIEDSTQLQAAKSSLPFVPKFPSGDKRCVTEVAGQDPTDEKNQNATIMQITERKIVSSRFGYSLKEVVGWLSSDKDVPPGSQGIISEFIEDSIAVKFPLGEFLFCPSLLYRVGAKTHGFKLGSPVIWESEDYCASDVPNGTVGILIETQGDKLVDFGTRQLLVEATDLRDVHAS